jgi:hypothetical protein
MDGGVVVSFTRLPPFTLGRFLVLVSRRPIVRLQGLATLKNQMTFSGNRIRDFPACSTVLQSTMLPCGQMLLIYFLCVLHALVMPLSSLDHHNDEEPHASCYSLPTGSEHPLQLPSAD